MSDAGGSVTLIFYSIGHDFWKEPFLNLVAAGATMSTFTHVEMAIGDEAGNLGQMSNVCRIFNDNQGVELTSRTGRNPQYSYIQLGCSKRAEDIMLSYARSLVGRPFSNTGMFRSIVYPRTTDGSSFFCAELPSFKPGQVAAVLKKGGLMSHSSNPGAATPQSLHKMYKDKAAMTGNPFLLRQFATPQNLSLRNNMGLGGAARDGRNLSYLNHQPQRRQNDSPPRATFRVVSDNGYAQISSAYLR